MLPCPGCARFIRSHADGCPFCGLEATTAPSPLGAMVASALLGLTLTACGSTGSDDDAADTSDTFEAAEVAAYGAPEVDTNLTQEDTIEPPDTTSSTGSSTGTGSTSTDSGSTGDGGSGSSGDGGSGSSSGGSDDSGSGSGTRGA